MLIRSFNLEDLDSILQIEQKVFSTPWSAQAFRDYACMSEFWFYVACAEKKLVGYFIAQVIGSEAELHNVAVGPDFQKRGLGKKIMEFFLKRALAAGVQDIFLLVRPSNLAAIKLYQHFGFGLIDCRKKYYEKNQEDALIFYKKINKLESTC